MNTHLSIGSGQRWELIIDRNSFASQHLNSALRWVIIPGIISLNSSFSGYHTLKIMLNGLTKNLKYFSYDIELNARFMLGEIDSHAQSAWLAMTVPDRRDCHVPRSADSQ